MKRAYFIVLILLLAFRVSGQTVIITEDLVAVNGKNLFKVKKTKGGNMLLETMPEFTVYDMQDKAWMKFEGDHGKMIFLDDNKSILPRVCDASVKSVAKFVAKDSIFTEKGFNMAYKKAYIAKHSGYFHQSNKELKYDEAGLVIRDKSKPVGLIENKISQDETIIGFVQRPNISTPDRHEIRVANSKDKVVGRANFTWNTSMPPSDVYKVDLYLPLTGQDVTLKVNGLKNIDQEVLNYLINKNHL